MPQTHIPARRLHAESQSAVALSGDHRGRHFEPTASARGLQQTHTVPRENRCLLVSRINRSPTRIETRSYLQWCAEHRTVLPQEKARSAHESESGIAGLGEPSFHSTLWLSAGRLGLTHRWDEWTVASPGVTALYSKIFRTACFTLDRSAATAREQ